MIDIETLSTKKNAIVLSLAAVPFSIPGGVKESEGIYIPLDWKEQMEPVMDRPARHVSSGTLAFWLRQLQEIREIAFLRSDGRKKVVAGLTELSKIIKKALPTTDGRIWAKGPQFDLMILRDLYEWTSIEVPWIYWQELDVRTALLHPAARKIKMAKSGTAHHPFDDAVFQARQVMAFLETFKKTGLRKDSLLT